MTTKPPRTRPGQAYPGGKKMRKAMAKLAARKSAWPKVGANKMEQREPGSMK